MSEAKTRWATRYFVYSVSEDGLLKQPQEYGYGEREYTFNQYGYESIEEAQAEIEKADKGDFLILPMYTKRGHW